MSIQAIIDAAISLDGQGRRVGGIAVLPSGDVHVPDTLKIENVRGLRVVGDRTRLVYAGPADRPAIRFAQANACSLERLSIVTTTPNTRSAVQFTNLPDPTGKWITTACRLVDVWLAHDGKKPFIDGIEIDSMALGGPDHNNELHCFERVTVSYCVRANCRIKGRQAHRILFDGCNFGSGRFGVWGEDGCYWEWRGGSMDAHTDADFRLSNFFTRVTIRGFNGENSRRFLTCAGTGAPVPISIDGVRWAGKPQVGDYVIDYPAPGPFELLNADMNSQGTNVPCLIRHSKPGGYIGPVSATFRNVILCHAGNAPIPTTPISVAGGQPVSEYGLVYRRLRGQIEDVRGFKIRSTSTSSTGADEPTSEEQQS